jgi:hypothetical protein
MPVVSIEPSGLAPSIVPGFSIPVCGAGPVFWARAGPPGRGAQILYWAYLGYALPEQPLPRAKQAAVLDEWLAIAAR